MRAILFVILFVCVVYSQDLGQDPCNPYILPGPYTTPLSLFGSNVDSPSLAACNQNFTSGIVWYQVAPDAAGNITVTTCDDNTNFDTVIYVLTGSCTETTCLGFNDDNCVSGRSSYSWVATEEVYIVGIGGYGNETGKFQATFSESGALTNGSDCQAALDIPGPYTAPVTIIGDNSQSGGLSDPNCDLNSASHIDWYTIYPNLHDQVALSTCFDATDFDTIISVFTGDCQSLQCTYFSDDNCTNANSFRASGLSFIAEETKYYVAVSGFSSAKGAYQFELSVSSTDCQERAMPISSADGSVQTFGSTTGEPPLPTGIPPCGAASDFFSSASWYVVTGSGTVTVSTCSGSTNFDTFLEVYSGSCSNLQCVTFNDDAPCAQTHNASAVTFTIQPNTDYWVIVGGFNGASGDYVISFTFS